MVITCTYLYQSVTMNFSLMEIYSLCHAFSSNLSIIGFLFHVAYRTVLIAFLSPYQHFSCGSATRPPSILLQLQYLAMFSTWCYKDQSISIMIVVTIPLFALLTP